MDVVQERINQWLGEIPDYYHVVDSYDTLGKIKEEIILLKRTIAREIENLDLEKPRSNEAKKRKEEATSHLYDQLAALESQAAALEQRIKKLEYIKSMFSSCTYAARIKAGF